MVATAITAAAITAAATGGTAAYTAHKQSKTAKEAGAVQTAANDAALDFEKAADARASQQYDEERARKWSLEDIDRNVSDENRALAQKYLAEDRAMSAEDRARHIAQGAPFAALARESVGSLRGLLNSNAGGDAFYLKGNPSAGSVKDLLAAKSA